MASASSRSNGSAEWPVRSNRSGGIGFGIITLSPAMTALPRPRVPAGTSPAKAMEQPARIAAQWPVGTVVSVTLTGIPAGRAAGSIRTGRRRFVTKPAYVRVQAPRAPAGALGWESSKAPYDLIRLFRLRHEFAVCGLPVRKEMARQALARTAQPQVPSSARTRIAAARASVTEKLPGAVCTCQFRLLRISRGARGFHSRSSPAPPAGTNLGRAIFPVWALG